MKCPNCGYNNRKTARFCSECGERLELICPACRNEIEATSKFCDACGTSLIASSAPDLTPLEEKIDKIQRYLPQGLTDKILSQRDRIEGEHKIVTVLFCDLVGYTKMAGGLDPEETYALMDRIMEILIHSVHDFGGTVNQLLGDGLYALFGAPIALEDGPQRAIRSAMDMHRSLTRFSDDIAVEKNIPPLKLRIGVNTGPVVVGTIGNSLRVDFTAIGDTVNLASRMEGLAEPGTTYVTAETFRQAEHFFRFEALGEKQVKGKEQGVGTYRVISSRSRRTRFDVSAERGLTPLVGRDRELEDLMDGFRLAKSGQGQALSVVAAAGTGKSRIIYEFRKSISSEEVTILEGKCISYHRNVPYYPIIDILNANFDIEDDETDEDILGKITDGLQVLKLDESQSLPVLMELLSTQREESSQLHMNPEMIKSQIAEIVQKIVRKGADITPLVLIFEDLHWIDKSSEALLGRLLEITHGSRILLVMTFRPEYKESWGRRSYHGQINLNRFSRRESLQMLTNFLKTESTDPMLIELVLEKTEGNPFFIEEFIQSLIDLGIVGQSGNHYQLLEDAGMKTIPASISDVIMARVDSLPERARELLQIGSVIEREFGYQLIRQITDLTDDELEPVMSIIKETELVYERGLPPEATYIFNHSLTREVIYDTILTARKQHLHEQVGTAIESLYSGDLQKHYEILGEHFSICGDFNKGDHYLKLACRKAEKTAALDVALVLGLKRVAFLEQLPDSDDVQIKLIDARTAVGLYYIQFNRHAEAKEVVEPVIDLAKKRDYQKRLSQIYTILGTFYFFVEEDIDKAKSYCDESVRISREIGNIPSLYFAYYWGSLYYAYNCDFEKASEFFKETISIGSDKKDVWGVSLMKSNFSIQCLNFQGKIKQAYKNSDEAVKLAEECGDVYSKAMAYTAHGASCYHSGFLDKAEHYKIKSIEYCDSAKIFLWSAISNWNLIDIYFDLRNYQGSAHHANIAIAGFNNLFPSVRMLSEINLFRAEAMNGKNTVDIKLLVTLVKRIKLKVFEGRVRRSLVTILLNIKEPLFSEATEWIESAIECDRRNDMANAQGRDHALFAELLRHQDKLSQAREQMETAIEIMKSCGADGWVERYESDLAQY